LTAEILIFLLYYAFKHLFLGSAWMLLSKLHHIKEICSKEWLLSAGNAIFKDIKHRRCIYSTMYYDKEFGF